MGAPSQGSLSLLLGGCGIIIVKAFERGEKQIWLQRRLNIFFLFFFFFFFNLPTCAGGEKEIIKFL